MRSWLFPLTCALVGFAAAAHAQSVTLLDTARLASPRLRESSGVTPSSRPGLFWTHNDSGDGPMLYATDSAGQDLGRIRVRGVGAIDWEDIGAGPCVVAPGRCLYIGDIGDNRSQRPRVTIYRLVEPVPPSGKGDTLRVVDVLDSLVLRYPGGPRDAETVIVTPGGTLLIVSKPRHGEPHRYMADLHAPPPTVLVDAGPLPISVNTVRGRLVTGGSISPDGRWVVIRTYVSLHFFRVDGTAHPIPAGGPDGIPIPYVETQGEGVAFDGPTRLVLTSEQGNDGHGLLARLRILLPDR
jgi:hypothetical protein